MNEPKFQFSNVVVVEEDQIGVIVKTWDGRSNKTRKSGYYYEVYVRSYNSIIEYHEDDIQHFVFSKTLTDEELEFYQ